jgi:hypothetical protein
MATRIAINGFGRIGRQVTKALFENHPGEFDLVAVNDLSNVKTNAHLFKYDSNYGIFPGTVEVDGNDIIISGDRVKVLAERDPSKLPWGDLGIDIVIESTGVFTDRTKAGMHLSAGAKKVIISAPAKGEDLTIVMGVNHTSYDPANHHVVSNASCTTNCLAPAAKVVNDTFGIEQGVMTTVHAYTNDQRILDLVHDVISEQCNSGSGHNVPGTAQTACADRVIGIVCAVPGTWKLAPIVKYTSPPKRPFVAIMGGAKISDKIAVIESLLQKVDAILIGGGMANTFLAAQGLTLGKSLVEAESLDVARQLMEKGVGVIELPVDVRVASAFAADAENRVVSVDDIPADWMALDIGPATIAHFANRLAGAKTVVWNGPMGVFEFPVFAQGTVAVAQILAGLSDAITIIGGGDSVARQSLNLQSLISTRDWEIGD